MNAISLLSWYTLLGIKETASKDEITAAYRRLVKIVHPDVCSDKDEATRLFKLVNQAYEQVLDMLPSGNGKVNNDWYWRGQAGNQAATDAAAESAKLYKAKLRMWAEKTAGHPLKCPCRDCINLNRYCRMDHGSLGFQSLFPDCTCSACGFLRKTGTEVPPQHFMDCFCPHCRHKTPDERGAFTISQVELNKLKNRQFWKMSQNGNEFFTFRDGSIVTIWKSMDLGSYLYIHDNDVRKPTAGSWTWKQAHRQVVKEFSEYVVG